MNLLVDSSVVMDKSKGIRNSKDCLGQITKQQLPSWIDKLASEQTQFGPCNLFFSKLSAHIFTKNALRSQIATVGMPSHVQYPLCKTRRAEIASHWSVQRPTPLGDFAGSRCRQLYNL